MAFLSTKRSSIYLLSGAVLPVPTAGFIALENEVSFSPNIETTDFKVINGNLGSNDSYVDDRRAIFNETLSHRMRSSNKAGTALETPPECGELLKVCGLSETIDTGTPGQETVIYTNDQNPTRGSAVMYIDDKKFTTTDSLVGDMTITMEAGSPAMLSASVSAYMDNRGIPVDEANPTAPTETEDLMIVTKTDLMTAGGSTIQADSIRLTMGAEVSDFYGTGNLCQYEITDYTIKIEADFFVDETDYAGDFTKIANQTVEALNIQASTDTAGALVNGKSMKIEADLAKANNRSDSIENGRVKRTMTWLLQNNAQNEAFRIKYGFFQ